MMALKMLYRGPSSRLENLIEKIQATKEIVNNEMYSTHTSSSYSPSISDGTITPNSLHHMQQQQQQQQQQNHHMQQLSANLQQEQQQQQHHHQQQPQVFDEESNDTRKATVIASASASATTTTTATAITTKSASAVEIMSKSLLRKSNGAAGQADSFGDAVAAGDTVVYDEHVRRTAMPKNISDSHMNNSNNNNNNINNGNRNRLERRGGGGAVSDVVEQLKRHHGRLSSSTLKMPASKLRKLDRTGSGAMSHISGNGGGGGGGKLTGEGKKHTSNADGSYQCQFCDKSFPRLGYLKKHEQSHAEHLPFKCDYCARLFKHKRSRDRHTKLHTGDRRYRCPHCEAAFSRSDHLKIHMKTHDNQKPFQCTICNRGYNTAAALTSHMQNHKKQAAILAAGGTLQALNYSPRSTGSASSNGSLHKRRYAIAAIATSDSSPIRLEHPKRLRTAAAMTASSASLSSPYLSCNYCSKTDFGTLEQFNAHVHKHHEKELTQSPPTTSPATVLNTTQSSTSTTTTVAESFQLACEYCTMKFPNIPAMFAHMRSTHIDRLSSPNSYFEHFNRLAASGTFSPRLIGGCSEGSKTLPRLGAELYAIKHEQRQQQQQHQQMLMSPRSSGEPPRSNTCASASSAGAAAEEEPTDLSQHHHRRSHTPSTPTIMTPPSPLQPSHPPAIQQQQHQHQHQQQQHQSQHSAAEREAPPGVFLCNQCNAGLPDFDSFRQHLKTHIVQGLQLVCYHCGMPMRDAAEHEQHIIAHYLMATTEFSCAANDCGKAYANTEDLQNHLLDQHALVVYKCAVCTELFDSKAAIQLHFGRTHSSETQILRCSACTESFRTEKEFNAHVKMRHQNALAPAGAVNGNRIGGRQLTALQCIFCRTTCASELEMHFHLAAHARQFRCPSCPETFHVEFLLDRHMQSQHCGNECNIATPNLNGSAALSHSKDAGGYVENNDGSAANSLHANVATAATPNATSSPINSLFSKTTATPLLPQSKNNSILDYNVAIAAAKFNKGIFSKFYSPLQVETSGMKSHSHSTFMYGLSQRYFDTNRTLIDMYAQHQQDKATAATVAAAAAAAAAANYFIGPTVSQQTKNTNAVDAPAHTSATTSANQQQSSTLANPSNAISSPGFSCDICERNDFRTESEVHSHRKIVHNMKTGVSLRCAYCAGNFKSRNELEHHMKTCHNSTGKHKCLICDEIFPSPAILAEHKLQHSKVGQSGKCSHCAQPLADVAAFKAHVGEHHNYNNNNNNNNNEPQMPVQCICCRQSLHSEFEIGLHAKFHTKSVNNMPESVCALCLIEQVPSGGSDAKVCEKCCRKHSLNVKFAKQQQQQHLHHKHHQQQQQQQHQQQHHYHTNERQQSTPLSPLIPQISVAAAAPPAPLHTQQQPLLQSHFIENRCNLCKMIFPHAQKLQEHLVEHTFAGCQERGYICYICSAVFTATTALLNHMLEHGLNARPYDCNLCSEKFYFRGELEHHMAEHDMQDQRIGGIGREGETASGDRNDIDSNDDITKIEQKDANFQTISVPSQSSPLPQRTTATSFMVKQEMVEADNKSNDDGDNGEAGGDDEYIEVEQVTDTLSQQRSNAAQAGLTDKLHREAGYDE